MTKFLIINGPNLNMLGTREPDIYGSKTLSDINVECADLAEKLGVKIEFYHSNIEGEIVSKIQGSVVEFSGIIINAGAYTHTSIAIRDALLSAGLPVIEVHISNIFKREGFRHHSYISDVALGMICGLGTDGYKIALNYMSSSLLKD
jgi:3-dehydroquinate dehydratase-2